MASRRCPYVAPLQKRCVRKEGHKGPHLDAAVSKAVAKRRAPKANPAPSYEASHWGEFGKGGASMMTIPEPEGCVLLGELVEVIYKTKKGGDEKRVEYRHTFKGPRPKLVYNRRGKLLIADGRYRVTERGIVG